MHCRFGSADPQHAPHFACLALPCLAFLSRHVTSHHDILCYFSSPAQSPSASNTEILSSFLPETGAYVPCKVFYVKD